METKWTIYKTDNAVEDHERNLPENPGYHLLAELCRDAVGGDIERVRVWHNGGYTDMFVNETGLLQGLPFNAAATEIYHANMKENEPGGYARMQKDGTLPPIAGNAVLFHRRVWF